MKTNRLKIYLLLKMLYGSSKNPLKSVFIFQEKVKLKHYIISKYN